MEELKNIEPLLWIGYTLLVVGIITTIICLRVMLKANASKNWDRTTGVIISSEVENVRNPGESSAYIPKVEYQYTIGDKIYSSNRVYFGSRNSPSVFKWRSMDVVNRYSKGQKVEVYYDRLNEKSSVLEAGIKYDIVLVLFVGILFLVAGYLVVTHPEMLKIFKH